MNYRKIPQLSILGFAAMSIVLSTAEARVKGPRVSSIAAGCGAIQDELDRIVDAFKNAKTRAEADALRQQGHNLVNDWNALGCGAAYGGWWRTISQRNWNWAAPNAGNVVVGPTRKSPRGSIRKPGPAAKD